MEFQVKDTWKNSCGVYFIINSIDNRFYVGSAARGFRQRFNDHVATLRGNKHKNIILQRFWDKYGEDSLIFVAVECVDSPKDAIVLEQHYLDLFWGTENLFNINPNAESPLGQKMTPEQRAANKRLMSDPERNKRVSELMKSRPLTDKHKERLRILCENNKGKKLSKAHREAISRGNKGKVLSEEHRKKVSEGRKRYLAGKDCTMSNAHKESIRWGLKAYWERRKRLAELLVIALVVGLFGACAGKTVSNYISAIPKPLDVSEFIRDAEKSPEFVVSLPDGCDFEKIPLPAGTLVTMDGERIQVPGGILISDCKAEQLINYKSAAERFYVERNQLALVYQSLNQACVQVETMYQHRLTEETNPDLWEQIDCEACFIAGAAMCIGIDYAIRENAQH